MTDDNQNAGNTGGAAQGNQQGQNPAPVTPSVPVPPATTTNPRQTLNTVQEEVSPRDTLNTSQHNNQSEARRSLNIIQKGGK